MSANSGDSRDVVLALDRHQSGWHEGAVWCKEREHGRLTAHPSGSALVCGCCTFGVPVDKDMLAVALALR